MIHRLVFGLAVLLGNLAAVSPATARVCSPLKVFATTNLVPGPANLELVPVTVNGSSKLFLLDTGGVFTQIAPGTVSTLHLKRETGAMPLYDASGNSSGEFVKVDALTLGGMTGNGVYLRVSPTNAFGEGIGALADGILAPDVLNRFDVEVDFAGQKLNYFLPDHCYGKVIYWPHGDVAQVSIELADKRWIKVPVQLDSRPFLAIIDTGASRTTISSKTALETFGLTASSPDMAQAGNVNNDPNLASYLHTFSSLTLDGITVKNPRIIVMPDRMTGADATTHQGIYGGPPRSTRIAMPELILGMDVLKHLHLYFAFQEHNLYVTAADVAPPTTNDVGAH
jgi:predicted aspartyl protease